MGKCVKVCWGVGGDVLGVWKSARRGVGERLVSYPIWDECGGRGRYVGV